MLDVELWSYVCDILCLLPRWPRRTPSVVNRLSRCYFNSTRSDPLHETTRAWHAQWEWWAKKGCPS